MHNNWQQINNQDGVVDFYPDFFSETDAHQLYQQLLNEVIWEQPEVKVFGKWHKVPRKTAFYGTAPIVYHYSGLTHVAKPYTPTIKLIAHKLNLVCPNQGFNVVLLNWYRNGLDKMGWHADDEPELGINPAIASVNFGATRTFQLKHKINPRLKFSMQLNNGSLLYMHGSCQHFWRHQVPQQKKVNMGRINLTFRKIIS